MEDAGGDEDKFDADVILSTGTLSPLLADLIDALGGEMSFVTSPAASEDLSDSPFV
jgi:DNA recombination-dependent growth factor C